LHLKTTRLQLREVNFRVLRQPHHINVVELYLGASSGTGLNGIFDHYRRVLGGGYIVTGIAPANRHVTVQ